MASFGYLAPASVEEAIELLKAHDGSRPIAGGTDLLVSISNRKINPRYVVDLKRLSGLDFIRPTGDGLEIGAMTSLKAVSNSPLVRESALILAEAAATVGSPQIRNWATLGGNLCNAAPSADTAPALLVLGALARIQTEEGGQVLPLSQFFTGPGATVLGRSGILTSVTLPTSSRDGKAVYVKYGLRKSMDIAVVGVAVWLRLEGTVCTEARIALGAVAPTPTRAEEAELALQGKELCGEVVERVAQVAAEACRPITDLRASADYRRELTRVLTKRALNSIIFAGGGDGHDQATH